MVGVNGKSASASSADIPGDFGKTFDSRVAQFP
jgi:hypothetical protein